MNIKASSLKAPYFFLLYFCTNPMLPLAVDTISANQTLTADQTLVSSGGNFMLGFFTPGNSSKHYIGIWYTRVSTQNIVWVANRETPISDRNSGQLTILDGNLVLLNESQVSIWSTRINSTSNSVIAVLLDDGNLVLRDGSGSNSNSNSTSIENLWESFNNPGHTWLPGGKLAYDKRTHRKQLLTSWKNSEDPAPGLFSLELDPNENQYIIRWNRTEQYWTSGPWNDQIFSGVPEMRLNYIYNFSYVNNENETYFTYSLYNPQIISKFIMDVSGQIKQVSWLDNTREWNLFWSQPRQQCEVYAFCGAFGSCNQNSLPFCNCLPGFIRKSESDWTLGDFSGGCVRETNLLCQNNSTATNGREDRFFTIPSVQLPVHSQSLTVGSSGECESACMSNCSCTAYSYDGNGCSFWNQELLSLQQLTEGEASGRTINIKLAASSSVFSSAKNNKNIVIGATVGSVAVLSVLAIVLFLVWRRQTSGTSKPVEGTVVAFGYKDLQNATKNFSIKLGGGGFGSVFKGILPDSTFVAVKKLESISQGEKQFRTEVATIGTIQHMNLVRLRGFCSDGNKKLLVYDYMEKGSLDSHLFFNDKTSGVLEWKTRYEIALGIAKGLAYLHEKCRDCIIHCDIKPENILLDPEYCPKVADFGLAKLVGRDFSRVLTTMRGTRGYLAPEWISGVAITAKADVYSYGMVLFELVSGRRNSEHSENAKIEFFPSRAASVVIEGGDVLGLVDPVLESGTANVDEVAKICKVACWCIQDDENVRPSMGQVVQILEGVMDVNLPPKPRSLQLFVENQEHIVFFTDSSSAGESSQTKSITSSGSSHSNTKAPSSS